MIPLLAKTVMKPKHLSVSLSVPYRVNNKCQYGINEQTFFNYEQTMLHLKQLNLGVFHIPVF
jgi:hypothetical protein